MDIISAIGEAVGILFGIKDLIDEFFGKAEEATEIIVQGGTEIIGFADAVKQPISVAKDFLSNVFPSDIVVMFGIAFTVIVALATRRSINA